MIPKELLDVHCREIRWYGGHFPRMVALWYITSGAIMTSSVDARTLERLLNVLPAAIRRLFIRLLHPEARRVRRPLGVLMILGGLCGFLPILGFWMLPVGLILIGEDIPVVKRVTLRALGALQGWWDCLAPAGARRAGLTRPGRSDEAATLPETRPDG